MNKNDLPEVTQDMIDYMIMSYISVQMDGESHRNMIWSEEISEIRDEMYRWINSGENNA